MNLKNKDKNDGSDSDSDEGVSKYPVPKQSWIKVLIVSIKFCNYKLKIWNKHGSSILQNETF